MSLFFCKKSRRAFVRGTTGAAIAIPFSQFAPYMRGRSLAQGADSAKLITFYFPNGCGPKFWNYEYALSPLLPLKNRITLFQNVQNAISEDAGGAPHPQGGANLFTGGKLLGRPVNEGVNVSSESLDQSTGRILNKGTTLGKPIVTGVWRGRAGGKTRPTCWYTRSWRNDPRQTGAAPVAPVSNPLDLFKIISPNAQVGKKPKKGEIEAVNAIKNSILDQVVSEYRSLTQDNSPFSTESKEIFRQHMDQVRELEIKSGQANILVGKTCKLSDAPKDYGADIFAYEDFDEIFKLQMDLVVLALSCGTSNTASLMFCSAGENYVNPKISRVNDHGSSHHKSDQRRIKAFIDLRKFHMSNMKYLMDGLAKVKLSKDQDLLDKTLIIAGSEFGDSAFEHVRSPQPHVIAGLTDKFLHDKVINAKGNHTSNDIYRMVSEAVGVKVNAVGEKKFNKGDIKGVKA